MVYSIGEIVLDIIFKSFDDVVIKPGGSMLNSAVSLGRLGVDVSYISVISNDNASDLLIDFLNTNNINSEYIGRNGSIKTNLALAYLNESNNAEYTFYKDKVDIQSSLRFPELSKYDIIHYGSFFSINKVLHNKITYFLNYAINKNCIKLYDPNFRRQNLPNISLLLPMVENNFINADIVKGSDEDFEMMYGIKNGQEVWELMHSFGVEFLFYTKGEQGSEFYCKKGKVFENTKIIDIVSTIGAGDTYSSAIIYFLKYQLERSCNLADISIKQWRDCVNIAHNFSSFTCQSMDNYLSYDFCNNYLNMKK